VIRIAATLVLFLLSSILCVAQDGPKKAANAKPAIASWIWLGEAKPAQAVFFRKEFVTKGAFSEVMLHATCDNSMTITIDGKPVAVSSEWEQPVHVDVTDRFPFPGKGKEAKHVIAVHAKNSDGPAGFVFKMTFTPRGAGQGQTLVSDGSWRASHDTTDGWQKPGFDESKWMNATVVAPIGGGHWPQLTDAFLTKSGPRREAAATPPDKMKIAKGFKVELLYSVPKDIEGSWVNLCHDPKGRLIVSDQYGGLYRVTPPVLGGNAATTKVEKIPAEIGEAQGLLWAFDALYVVVNRGQKYDSGLYRVTSSKGDDTLDKVELLRRISGGGEHGPHAVVLSPDGQSLHVICGNHTQPIKFDSSRVPQIWKEDHLLPRMWDAGGHAVGIMAPGGWIAKTDPKGLKWELVSMGYRNPFDMSFNRQGDLFTFDADMEWDMNTPWYRPTRVCFATSGSEFGWRSGTGKWPTYYPDSLPAVVDIGPGSPTGVTFGYGAKFPAKYQEAFFICDWSYGKLYCVHVRPDGAGYSGDVEEFTNGSPLPLTDVIVNPHDGAMYFTIGGRRTKSGLYRVTYVGNESVEKAPPLKLPSLHAERRKLEAFHGTVDEKAVDAAWPYLAHDDRYLRYAARVAIEFQAVATWQARALGEKRPHAAITALIALARIGDKELLPKVLAALQQISEDSLTVEQQLELYRAYGLAFTRMGPPDDAAKRSLVERFDRLYPSRSREINSELCQLLIYLESPTVAARTLRLIASAPTQEEQLDLIKSLRVLKAGWTPETRKEYFEWFIKAANYRGGHSFAGFIRNIKNEAVATLTSAEKESLRAILDVKPDPKTAVVAKPRPIVKQRTTDEVVALVEKSGALTGRDFDRGRRLFGEANCFSCHRFANEGGATGPDLTGLSGRFSVRDLVEAIVEPSRVISDQYVAVTVTTTNGKEVTGRIVNLNGEGITINTNMLDPNLLVSVNRRQIESMENSKVSMMPAGLLDVLKEDEVLDLMAFLLSRGDPKSAMFKK
jgi:putative heme-binding domain-containing protein